MPSNAKLSSANAVQTCGMPSSHRGGQWGEVELKKVSVEVISFQHGAASNWQLTLRHTYTNYSHICHLGLLKAQRDNTDNRELEKMLVEVIILQQGTTRPSKIKYVQIIVISDTWVDSRQREKVQDMDDNEKTWFERFDALPF